MIEHISEKLIFLWGMMGIFLPFFILVGIFQMSLTLFCLLKLVSKKEDIENHEAHFIESLTFINQRLSGIALTFGLIGTVYGLVSALSHLATGWATMDQDVLAKTMEGASIALTSTLGALIFARLWGDEINDGFIAKIKKKYGIPDLEELSKKQLSSLNTISTNLNRIGNHFKKLKSYHPAEKKSSKETVENGHREKEEIEMIFFQNQDSE